MSETILTIALVIVVSIIGLVTIIPIHFKKGSKMEKQHFEVGDIVRILPPTDEDLRVVYWAGTMRKSIGKTGRIVDVLIKNNVYNVARVIIDGGNELEWVFPLNALAKVESVPPTKEVERLRKIVDII